MPGFDCLFRPSIVYLDFLVQLGGRKKNLPPSFPVLVPHLVHMLVVQKNQLISRRGKKEGKLNKHGVGKEGTVAWKLLDEVGYGTAIHLILDDIKICMWLSKM